MKKFFPSLSFWRLKYYFLRKLWDMANLLSRVRGMHRVRKAIRKVFFEDKYIRTPYFSGSVFVCPTHIMGETVFRGEIHEPELTKLIQTFTQSGYSFIDVGANIGLHTVVAASSKHDKSRSIFAFEPDPAMFSLLEKNCRLNNFDYVDCFQEGLADKNSILTLNISQTRNKGHNSFLPINNASKEHQVRVSTLDTKFGKDVSLLSKNIFMKIDVEGYELPVIQCGKTFISSVSNMVIACEVWTELMEENGFSVDVLYNTLADFGLRNHTSIADAVIFYKGKISKEILTQLGLLNGAGE